MNEIIAELQKIKTEIDKMYFIIMGDKDISLYKSRLLTYKMYLLINYQEELMKDSQDILKKEEAKIKFLNILRCITILYGGILIFHNIFMAGTLFLGGFLISKKINNLYEEFVRQNDQIIKALDDMGVLANELKNCLNFLMKHTNENSVVKETDLEDKSLNSVKMADCTVEFTFENEILAESDLDEMKINMLNEKNEIEETFYLKADEPLIRKRVK